MTTYLFVTKPEYSPQNVKHRKIRWSCAKSTQPGDEALVYVTGQGISYEWRATTEAKKDPKWRYVCNVEYIADVEPPITIQELRKAIQKTVWSPPHQNFRGIKAISVPDQVVETIRGLRNKTGVKLLPSVADVERNLAAQLEASSRLSSAERRQRLRFAEKRPHKTEVTTTVFIRNADVMTEVRERAKGHCERCKAPAPFSRASDGTPYLEVHHRTPLADGGEDTTKNALALCPNCHRQAHYG